jgi:hypothetical protein
MYHISPYTCIISLLTRVEVLISFGSEFHTFGPLKEKLDLYNSVFGFGTRKLSDDENLVSYDSLLFVTGIKTYGFLLTLTYS